MSAHSTHCCKTHGCKYGDDDCPVFNGSEPGVQCEDCQEDDLKSFKPRKEITRFDLEAQMMKCWQVLDGLDTVTEGVLDYDWTPDQVSNATIGLKEIYQLEFEKLQGMFELLVRNGDIK